MTTAGDNSAALGATRALLFHHFNLIQSQEAKVAAEKAVLKKLRKEAKADGCTMGDLDFMARCAGIEDPSIVPAEVKRRTEIASWFALPVNFQPDMFQDREPLEDRAFREGERDSLLGKDPKPPYDETGPAGQAWMRGWHDGQRQRREEMQAAMEKKNSAAATAGAKKSKQSLPEHDGAFPGATVRH